MKKYLRFITAFLLVFLLAGCGGNAAAEENAVGTKGTVEAEVSGISAEDAVEGDEDENGIIAGYGTDAGPESGSIGEAGSGAINEGSAADDETEMEENGAGETAAGEDAPEGTAETATGGDMPAGTAETVRGENPDMAAEDSVPEENPAAGTEDAEGYALSRDGIYTSKEDVALYIHLYGQLPSNFITKKEAESLGWPGGSLEPYAPGKCIGGSRFGNYEGILPEKEGRFYTECDIDTLGAEKRGAKRIVFSNDGLIYYTEDHYQSFELLYEG